MGQVIVVTASQVTQGPGLYLISAPGLTITLESFVPWAAGDLITIKDMTGSSPNITVVPSIVGGLTGTIDGLTSKTLTVAYEALEFRPWLGGNRWIVT